MGDERPGDRLDQTAGGKSPLGPAGAGLDEGEQRLEGAGSAAERRRRHAVDADDAHHLLDEIGLDGGRRAPARHGDRERPLRAMRLGHEAERGKDAAHLGHGGIDAAKAFHLGDRELDDIDRVRNLAGEEDLAWASATEIHDHLGGEFETRHVEGRVDAALVAVAGVGVDAELAAGLGDVERFPQRRLDENVGGRLRAAGELAADDAGQRFDAVFVGNHAHRRIERVGAAVERQQFLAVAGAANDEIALDLGGVEDVQRAVAVVGDEIGDIDQRVDGAQADGAQPLLQPGRRRAVLHAAHEAQAEGEAERRRVAEIERDLDRTGAVACDRHHRALDEIAEAGGGEIARDAVDAQCVRPVGRDRDIDHRIVEAGIDGIGLTDRRIRGQIDDALMIVGDAKLAFGQQHAVRLDAADDALFQLHAGAGNEGACRGEDAGHAGACIGRTADDLDLGAVARIDDADTKTIRIGVLLGGEHACQAEGGVLLGRVVDRFDLEADHGELVDDAGKRHRRIEMLFQPGEGELHDDSPPASDGRSSGRKP